MIDLSIKLSPKYDESVDWTTNTIHLKSLTKKININFFC